MSARSYGADVLLDAVMPRKGGFAVVLQGYFDESERPDGTFAVAGFAYSKGQAQACLEEWDSLFEEWGGCHMSELAHAQDGIGRFAGLSTTETGNLLTKAIAIINARAELAVAVSCDLEEIKSLLPTWIRGFEGAYPVCCHMAMTAMGELAGVSNEIAYVFEEGHAHQKHARAFMSRVVDVPSLKNLYRHYSDSFADKDKVSLLQTADVLVWECTKYWDETVLKRERLMRRSLVALITKGSMKESDYDKKRIKMMRLTGEPLRKFCDDVKGLGLMQIAESG